MSAASSKEVPESQSQPPPNLRHRWFRRGETPKTFGHPVRIVFNVLLIFIISQFTALLVVEAGTGLIHGGSSNANILDQSAAAQFVYVFFAEGLAVLLTFWILKKRGLRPAAIGWGRRPRWGDLTKGLLGFVAFFVLLIVVMSILSAVFPSLRSNQTQDVGFNSLNSSLDWLLAFVALIFLPPLGEETLVRGYLFSGLRSHWRFLPAMLLTSLLFGLAHLQSGSHGGVIWGAAIDTFLLSTVLVYLREATGALYAGMLIHSLNNLLAFFSHFHAVLF